jgi:2-oxoglutarate/2-oxoacid ferredoxin oxidoreductase subunit alpha
MRRDDIAWAAPDRMAGAGGDGVISAGESLINAAALTGYHAILTKSFGPQIRGGESSFRLRVAAKEVFAVSGTLDVAIASTGTIFCVSARSCPSASARR